MSVGNIYFLLIWENSNINDLINQFKQNNKPFSISLRHCLDNFVKRIKYYLESNVYIKFKNKPILSLENPMLFKKPQKVLLILRNKFKKNGIRKIFIICPFNKTFFNKNYTHLFDAAYDSPYIDYFEYQKKYEYIDYYSGIIYKNIILNQMNESLTIFRSSITEIKRNKIFNSSFLDYTPEKFYILNNIIINWTITNYKETKGIFFIKSWNDFEKGNYLEPDDIFKYASINSFSKALFNLSFYTNQYNYHYLYNRCIIAIQAHIFYKEMIFEIINKTNNIPLNFDLFISTLQTGNLKEFEENIRNYSKASKYEILYVNNKGRDVLPFLIQMKNHINKYKYICHLHTKKTDHIFISGNSWRNYLYENLLGNSEQISRILFDFENFEELGFIFPEPFYSVIKNQNSFDVINFKYHEPNIKYMNFVLNKIFSGIKVGKKLIFPVGNMFWAKTKAIHQIFKIKLKYLFPKESGQINETIMHAIERIWLYLAKKNGYCYKIIFNHY